MIFEASVRSAFRTFRYPTTRFRIIFASPTLSATAGTTLGVGTSMVSRASLTAQMMEAQIAIVEA
jgi:hypothetical protein